MAATYDSTLPTTRDFVRFAVRDTDVTAGVVVFQDEELDALIEIETATGDALKWSAAASAMEVLWNQYTTAGKGKMTKRVDDFMLRWGVEDSASDAIGLTIKSWKIKAATLLNPKPVAFTVL